ncbi:MAG: carboxypeptidase-like regulatory domain-containing protein [Vicinamibacterales bacterium]
MTREVTRVTLPTVLVLIAAASLPAARQGQPPQAGEMRVIETGGGGRASPLPPGSGPGAAIGGPAGGGLAPQATIPAGTGLIMGTTLDAGSARPVGGALVTLRLPGAAPIRALSDGQGRFVFRGLPAGSFTLDSTKPGYVDGAYGRARPGGPSRALALSDGERLATASIALWKFAVVAGRVVDERGDPMVGTTVQVIRMSLVGGNDRFVLGPSDATDDRGMYRIGMLEPGNYVVAVPRSQQDGLRSILVETARTGSGGPTSLAMGLPAVALPPPDANGQRPFVVNFGTDVKTDASAGLDPDGRPRVYATVFHPDAPTASKALSMTLTSGQVRSGVDFQMRSTSTRRVAGRVRMPDGQPISLSLTLVPVDSDGMPSPFETATALADTTGAFTFAAVPEGQYLLRAVRVPRRFTSFSIGSDQLRMVSALMAASSAPDPGELTLWAEQSVTVGSADTEDVGLTLHNGNTVSGQVELDASSGRLTGDQMQRISLTLEPLGSGLAAVGGPVSGHCDASNRCVSGPALPGPYVVRLSGLPQNWFFRGASLDGRDVTDSPLDLESSDLSRVTLTLTTKVTDLSGIVVRPMASRADDGDLVIAFPEDRGQWTGYGTSPRRLRAVRADTRGAFSITGLPAGRYLLAAVRDSSASDWQRPAFLETLVADAVRVDLSEGAKVTQSVKLVTR